MKNKAFHKITSQESLGASEMVDRARKDLLDLLEIVLAESSSWPIVRSRVLAIFGRQGLQRLAYKSFTQDNRGTHGKA